MTKGTDECLNLEQLLTRCKELEPETMLRIYFDPGTYWFYITYFEMMGFFLPGQASFICESRAENVRLGIEFYIASAVRISDKPDKE